MSGVAFTLEEFGRVIKPGGAGVIIASMASRTIGSLPPAQERQLASAPSDELAGLPFAAAGKFFGGGHAYGFAKRANILRVQAAAATWGLRGARINSVSPGVIATALTSPSEPPGRGAAWAEERVVRRGKAVPSGALRASGRYSAAASFITGADLLVDGGVTAALASGDIDLSAILQQVADLNPRP